MNEKQNLRRKQAAEENEEGSGELGHGASASTEGRHMSDGRAARINEQHEADGKGGGDLSPSDSKIKKKATGTAAFNRLGEASPFDADTAGFVATSDGKVTVNDSANRMCIPGTEGANIGDGTGTFMLVYGLRHAEGLPFPEATPGAVQIVVVPRNQLGGGGEVSYGERQLLLSIAILFMNERWNEWSTTQRAVFRKGERGHDDSNVLSEEVLRYGKSDKLCFHEYIGRVSRELGQLNVSASTADLGVLYRLLQSVFDSIEAVRHTHRVWLGSPTPGFGKDVMEFMADRRACDATVTSVLLIFAIMGPSYRNLMREEGRDVIHSSFRWGEGISRSVSSNANLKASVIRFLREYNPDREGTSVHANRFDSSRSGEHAALISVMTALFKELSKIEHQDTFFLNGQSSAKEPKQQDHDQQQGDEKKRKHGRHGKDKDKNKNGDNGKGKDGGNGKGGGDGASVNQIEPLKLTSSTADEISKEARTDVKLLSRCLNCAGKKCEASGGRLAATFANPLDKSDKTVVFVCSVKACCACGDPRHTASWCRATAPKVSKEWLTIIPLFRTAGQRRAHEHKANANKYGSGSPSRWNAPPAAASSQEVDADPDGKDAQDATAKRVQELLSEVRELTEKMSNPSKKPKNGHFFGEVKVIEGLSKAQVGLVAATSHALIAKAVVGGLASWNKGTLEGVAYDSPEFSFNKRNLVFSPIQPLGMMFAEGAQQGLKLVAGFLDIGSQVSLVTKAAMDALEKYGVRVQVFQSEAATMLVGFQTGLEYGGCSRIAAINFAIGKDEFIQVCFGVMEDITQPAKLLIGNAVQKVFGFDIMNSSNTLRVRSKVASEGYVEFALDYGDHKQVVPSPRQVALAYRKTFGEASDEEIARTARAHGWGTLAGTSD